MTDEKKNLFDKVIDAVTDRDEKAAAEAARIEAAAKAETEARQKIAAKAAADTASAKAKAEAEARAAAAVKAKAEADAAAKAKAAADALAQAQAAAKAKAEAEAQAAAKAAWEALPRHVLAAEETLSHIALKYYGHATEPYWRLIYEANKETIGPNPSHVHAGLKLVIPNLPAELKK